MKKNFFAGIRLTAVIALFLLINCLPVLSANPVEEAPDLFIEATEIIREAFYGKTNNITMAKSFLAGMNRYSKTHGLVLPASKIAAGSNRHVLVKDLKLALQKTSFPADRTWDLVRAGISQIVEDLPDRGCRFYEPGKYRKSLKEMGYSKGGCGFFADREPDRDGYFTIIETLQEFPAEKGGVRSGDRIVDVDGKPVKGMSFFNLADAVRGPVGSTVKITVIRDGKYITIPIVRTWLGPNPNSLRTEILENGIGYVKFRFLGDRISYNLMETFEIFKQKGVKGIILDLRCSAGSMDGALDLASLYVPKGRPFIFKTLKGSHETFTGKQEPLSDLPMVVLMNRYTDPSCALLALSLQKYANIKLIGESMEWDSDIVQTSILKDGSAISIVYGYYEFPDGRILKNKDRIEPDVKISQNPVPPYGSDGDIQLKTAVEALLQK